MKNLKGKFLVLFIALSLVSFRQINSTVVSGNIIADNYFDFSETLYVLVAKVNNEVISSAHISSNRTYLLNFPLTIDTVEIYCTRVPSMTRDTIFLYSGVFNNKQIDLNLSIPGNIDTNIKERSFVRSARKLIKYM